MIELKWIELCCARNSLQDVIMGKTIPFFCVHTFLTTLLGDMCVGTSLGDFEISNQWSILEDICSHSAAVVNHMTYDTDDSARPT